MLCHGPLSGVHTGSSYFRVHRIQKFAPPYPNTLAFQNPESLSPKSNTCSMFECHFENSAEYFCVCSGPMTRSTGLVEWKDEGESLMAMAMCNHATIHNAGKGLAACADVRFVFTVHVCKCACVTLGRDLFA